MRQIVQIVRRLVLIVRQIVGQIVQIVGQIVQFVWNADRPERLAARPDCPDGLEIDGNVHLAAYC